MGNHFIAVARTGADPMLVNYPKIVLRARDLESARSLLPDTVREYYSLFPMSARAVARIEAAMRPNARCP